MRPVRFATTHDGLSLAWTRSGSGPALIKASAWLTHLQYDDQSPVWSHWVSFLESHFDYLRYDERGCGMSDHEAGQLDLESWTDDLGRIIDAANLDAPFALLAMSQGTGAAVAYAARYPDRVSHLILIGGYARGPYQRDDEKQATLYRAIVDVFSAGFDDKNPAFREVFTKRFLQDGDPEKIKWFNELCQRTVTAKVGAQLLDARAKMNATAFLADVKCPTLVLHARGDGVVPISEGRFLAQHIAGAELHILDSENHVLQTDEPAWEQATNAILGLLGGQNDRIDFGLTARETTILSEICAAKSNKDIARNLDVSEKTVRNHATRIFAKLGVTTRQEAILKMQKSG